MAASEPTSSLSSATDALIPLTLSQHLGTLAAVWVVPLSEVQLTHTPRLPSYDAHTFGVEQEVDSFRSLNPQFVPLPYGLSDLRLDCGLFRQEPAITELDGLFTPNPRSQERLHPVTLKASTRFYPCFA